MKKTILAIVGILILNCTGAASGGADDKDFEKSVEMLLGRENINSSKLKAVERLEKSGNSKAIPYLIAALKDKEFPYPLDAIHALGQLGGFEARNFLEEFWRDLEIRGRKALTTEQLDYTLSQQAFIAAALYKMGVVNYVEFTYELTKSKDKGLRYNAAVALGMVNSKRSRELLYSILKNDGMELPRYGAAKALAELGDAGVLPAVKDLVERGELPSPVIDEVIEQMRESGGKQGESKPTSK